MPTADDEPAAGCEAGAPGTLPPEGRDGSLGLGGLEAHAREGALKELGLAIEDTAAGSRIKRA